MIFVISTYVAIVTTIISIVFAVLYFKLRIKDKQTVKEFDRDLIRLEKNINDILIRLRRNKSC